MKTNAQIVASTAGNDQDSGLCVAVHLGAVCSLGEIALGGVRKQCGAQRRRIFTLPSPESILMFIFPDAE